MHPLIIMLFVCLFTMVCGWLWQKHNQNAGYVDVIWSFLLGFQASYYLIVQPNYSIFLTLGMGLAIFWSLRLTTHLLLRVSRESEDGRYAALRTHWAPHTQRNFLLFYLAQGLLAWGFGFVFYQLAEAVGHQVFDDQGLLSFPVFITGLLLGISAILIEGLADKQLSQHRSSQPGVTCRSGLWRYSRHPNYFFEWLHWWSYPLMASGLGLSGEMIWAVWLAPLLMLLFLYRLTGIPYTEKQALKSRGDDYRRYIKETSAFIPWFPKYSD